MTPTQCRMARAGLKLSTRDLAALVSLSHTIINRFENDDDRLSMKSVKAIEAFFAKRRVFFGPADGVCFDQNVFDQERFVSGALFRLLAENGIKPDSRQLLDAGNRAERQPRAR